jgi:urea transport system permease protein
MLGAFMVQGAQSYLGDQFLSTWLLILGFFFILVVRFLPGGLAGFVEDLFGHLSSKRFDKKVSESELKRSDWE